MYFKTLLFSVTLLSSPAFCASPELAQKTAGIMQIDKMLDVFKGTYSLDINQAQLEKGKKKFVELLVSDYTDAELKELLKENEEHNVAELIGRSITMAGDLQNQLMNIPSKPLPITISDSYRQVIDKKMADDQMDVNFATLFRAQALEDNPGLSDKEREAIVSEKLAVLKSFLYKLMADSFTEQEYVYITQFESSPLSTKVLGTYMQALQTS